jgi:putative membrane protein
MISAFIVSALFLMSYVYYHSQVGDTKFLGEGWIRPVYFFILITHIVLSMIVFPMVLSTIYFGLTDKRATHRKIARITLPIWLYVSATGVIIFFMLRANS